MTNVSEEVRGALEEDIGTGDVSAQLLPDNLLVSAEIISREPMVVCGIDWVNEVFKQIDNSIKIEWKVADSDVLAQATTLCTLSGNARSILTGERTALNFLQTLSGTATHAHEYVQKLKGTNTKLLDTRKTIPGLRLAQKYAVRCGGGVNHRIGLYDAYLIKENHIKACGSVAKAIELARNAGKNLLIEIEVETLDQLREALHAKADRVLLDNFNLDMMRQAVTINTPKQCELEASGGINVTTIAQVAATGVDFISVGVITKSVRAIDLSLLVRNVL